jgi:hypothetical protein
LGIDYSMTKKPSRLTPDDPEQSRRFIEIAEAHKADKRVPLKDAIKKLASHQRETPKVERSTRKG